MKLTQIITNIRVLQCFYLANRKISKACLRGGGGGGPTTKKIMPPGKTHDFLMSFLFFIVLFQNRRFCAKFGQTCALKKRQKRSCPLSFFVLFCCFYRIWLVKFPQTESRNEQKRSCRRENRKMSFVFYVVGPPPLDFKLNGPEGETVCP